MKHRAKEVQIVLSRESWTLWEKECIHCCRLLIDYKIYKSQNQNQNWKDIKVDISSETFSSLDTKLRCELEAIEDKDWKSALNKKPSLVHQSWAFVNLWEISDVSTSPNVNSRWFSYTFHILITLNFILQTSSFAVVHQHKTTQMSPTFSCDWQMLSPSLIWVDTLASIAAFSSFPLSASICKS
jgi:hypothetical protein